MIRPSSARADKQGNGFLLTREVSWRPTRRRRRLPTPPPGFQPPLHATATVRTWREGLTFSGTGGEYFGIWIVNILLSVLTLGVYSAWAKVRRMQFFYRNTQLAGAGFDYHGNPWAILKGRIIASSIMGAYYGLAFISPIAGGVAFLAVLTAMPWFISRALRFRLYNTSYRGLRFRFTGTTGEAYIAFLLMPIATLLTLGLLGPMWHQRLKNYVHSNAWYGRTRFSFSATVGSFYGVYMQALGLLVAFGMAGMVLAGPFLIGAFAIRRIDTRASAFTIGVSVSILLYMLASMTLWAFTTSRIQNLAWNNTQLGPHQFVSSIKVGQLAFITVDQPARRGLHARVLQAVRGRSADRVFSERVHGCRVGKPQRLPGRREADGRRGRRRSDRDVRSRSRGLMER